MKPVLATILLLLLLVEAGSAMKRPVSSRDLVEMLKTTPSSMRTALQSRRERREAVEEKDDGLCKEAELEWENCLSKVTDETLARLESGGDGRSNFMARKACTAMEKILDCGDRYRADCSISSDAVDEVEEEGMQSLVETFENFPGFDGSLCPAYRYIMFGEPRGGSGGATPLLNLFLPATSIILALRHM